MNRFLVFFNLNKVSFFLIALPYLAFNSSSILQSPFFTISKVLYLLVFFLSIDVFIKIFLQKLNTKFYTTVALLTILTSILFFYGFYMTFFLKKELKLLFNLIIRGRVILEIIITIFTAIIFFFRNKRIQLRYLNVFLILFSISATSISVISLKPNNDYQYKSNFISIPKHNKTSKSVILIIADEYTSPDDLYMAFKDSGVYNFSNALKSKGWITKNKFYSYETSTIHSLSSLFNFNLSQNLNYQNEKIGTIGTKKLIGAAIADSLQKKNIDIVNFGIFHIGNSIYLNRLYLYPNSFIEEVMMQTIYFTIKTYTGNFNESGLVNSYYPMEAHNKFIINHLIDSLKLIKSKKSFIYAHLYMPHIPMKFGSEFSFRAEYNLNNYIAYWDFTNRKLKTLLNDLVKENKYQIILTGDHGYRDDKRINQHLTFTAFYGFSKESVDKINSVQDLGSLINGSY